MADDIKVADNPQAARFELHLDGKLAGIAGYVLDGGTITLTHTEVEPEYQGRGLASHLARFALDSAREAGLKVIPRCPYMARYVARHPEYADLVTDTSSAPRD
jgi:Predicted acetyltransferase